MGRAVKVFSIAIFLSAFAVLGRAQSPSVAAPADADAKNPGQAFYLKLRSVGLNKSQVYKIREASLDRAQLHISLDDGTIAFTEAVDGHITELLPGIRRGVVDAAESGRTRVHVAVYRECDSGRDIFRRVLSL